MLSTSGLHSGIITDIQEGKMGTYVSGENISDEFWICWNVFEHCLWTLSLNIWICLWILECEKAIEYLDEDGQQADGYINLKLDSSKMEVKI